MFKLTAITEYIAMLGKHTPMEHNKVIEAMGEIEREPKRQRLVRSSRTGQGCPNVATQGEHPAPRFCAGFEAYFV